MQPATAFEFLTDRQRDVLKAAANGLTEKETAKAMNLSWHTVKDYRRSALRYLNARSITEACIKADRAGVLS